MAINLSTLSSIQNAAVDLSNLILVSPEKDAGIKPQVLGADTISTDPKFLFNYYGDQTLTLECDITDNYVEDNTALQDQIAIRPDLITGQGFIAELTDIAPEILEPLKIAVEKLTVISAYVPKLSITAQLAYNQAVQTYQVASLAAQAAVSAWSSVAGSSLDTTIDSAVFSGVQNKQQKAAQMFYGYQKKRTLFTVQTPWAIFKNCAIKSLKITQDAETRMISTFDVTFKPINFARSQLTDINGNLVGGQGRFNDQASPVSNNGQSTPFSVGKSQGSFLSGVTSGAGN